MPIRAGSAGTGTKAGESARCLDALAAGRCGRPITRSGGAISGFDKFQSDRVWYRVQGVPSFSTGTNPTDSKSRRAGFASRTLRLTARCPLMNTATDEADEEPTANPFLSTCSEHCDPEFGDIVSDEAVSMACLSERPIPGGADGFVLLGSQPIVAWPRPSSEIQRVLRVGEHLVGSWGRLVRTPYCSLAQHGRQKG